MAYGHVVVSEALALGKGSGVSPYFRWMEAIDQSVWLEGMEAPSRRKYPGVEAMLDGVTPDDAALAIALNEAEVQGQPQEVWQEMLAREF